MDIIIKPYESKYRVGVVDVLQHLWLFPEKERFERFDWLYESNSNPSFSEPLAVVAVNENDEVLGFRGWVPGIVWQKGKQYIVARAADVVVSPKARRQGIFTKMTTFSLSYLKEKGVSGILNLSSNSQSNPGNIKLGWEPLVQLNIWYKIRIGNAKKLSNKEGYEYQGHRIFLYPYIPQGLRMPSSDSLCFSMNEGQLDWYSKRPYKEYLTAVSYDVENNMSSLFIIDKREIAPSLILFYSKNQNVGIYTFKLICNRVNSWIIGVWGWALTKEQSKLLRSLGFVRIPFYEKIKKKPPILVRTVSEPDKDGEWKLGDKDIRDKRNWSISLIDNF